MKIFSIILNSVGLNTDDIDNVCIEGKDPVLPSPFLIGEAGAAALAAVGYAASELWYLKTKRHQQVSIKVKEAAIAQRSHEYLQVLDSEKQELWSPISGFYQTQDNRWIQFHCNFPDHLQGVLTLLGCSNDKAAVTTVVKNWHADELEETLSSQDMCAAIVRSPEEWQSLPQAKAIETLPLMEIIKIGNSNREPLPQGNRPLSGIKALDLSRVIAGPICGRTLAEHGATVMLISSPTLPSILPLVMDTGHGKLSAFLDLNKIEDKEKLIELIKTADIFSQSYRPGGLASRGFSPEELAQLRPGIIYISFSAYSHKGPWANRHGYDSLVQFATGIVYEQTQSLAIKPFKPQHLPAQSLDYITGYLAAFGAMEALRRRAIEGGSYLVRVSLAQTALWFKNLGRAKDFSLCQIPSREQIKNLLTQTNTKFGRLEYLLPVLKMSETSPFWDRPTVPLGCDQPQWPNK